MNWHVSLYCSGHLTLLEEIDLKHGSSTTHTGPQSITQVWYKVETFLKFQYSAFLQLTAVEKLLVKK